MTKERFVQILNDCGITNNDLVNKIWDERPGDDLDEDRVVRASSLFLRLHGLGSDNKLTQEKT